MLHVNWGYPSRFQVFLLHECNFANGYISILADKVFLTSFPSRRNMCSCVTCESVFSCGHRIILMPSANVSSLLLRSRLDYLLRLLEDAPL
jgi:hypothetical protein